MKNFILRLKATFDAIVSQTLIGIFLIVLIGTILIIISHL
jgi:hypothetical protein